MYVFLFKQKNLIGKNLWEKQLYVIYIGKNSFMYNKRKRRNYRNGDVCYVTILPKEIRNYYNSVE